MKNKLKDLLFVFIIFIYFLVPFEHKNLFIFLTYTLIYFINPLYLFLSIPFLYSFEYIIIIQLIIFIVLANLSNITRFKYLKMCTPFLLSSIFFLINTNYKYSLIYLSILLGLNILVSFLVVRNDFKDYRINRYFFFLIISVFLYFINSSFAILLACELIFYFDDLFFSPIVITYAFFETKTIFVLSIILVILKFLNQTPIYLIILGLLTYFLFTMNPYYLIFSFLNVVAFVLKRLLGFSIEITTPENQYHNYLQTINETLKDLNKYEELDIKINSLIHSYCLMCDNAKKCFSKNKINLYQYLMFQSTNNMKMNPKVEEFIFDCIHKQEMDKLDKIDFEPYISSRHICNILNTKYTTNNTLFKLRDFLYKNKYNPKMITNNSINSHMYVLTFDKIDFSKSIFNYRLKKALKENMLVSFSKNEIKISNKPLFKLSYDSIILSKGNLYISGDNILIKKMGDEYYFSLSDGMGSGLKAYEASKDMLKRISALINLRLKNIYIKNILTELYQLSGYHDTYGTLDLLHINRTTFEASLYKVASSKSIIIRDHKAILYQTNTLPLAEGGIISSYEITLQIDDLIILCSDGVSDHISDEELNDFLLYACNLPVNKIVYELSKLIYTKSNNKFDDDLSIIAIKINPIL